MTEQGDVKGAKNPSAAAAATAQSMADKKRALAWLQTAMKGDQMAAKVLSVGNNGQVHISANMEGLEFVGKLEEVLPGQHARFEGLMQKQPSVIIVGAGFAGLAAGQELKALGCKVTLVEARDRVGGRCWTDDIEGRKVDMGAGWIHGVDGNPVAELAHSYGIELYDIPSDTVIHGPDGAPVPNADDDLVEKLFNDLLRRAQDEAGKAVDDESLGEKLDTLLKTDDSLSSDLQKHIFQWHCANVEYSTATDIHNLSVRNWAVDDAHAFPGEHCLLKQGYGTVAKGISAGLDIRFNCEVVTVEHPLEKQEPCKVHMSDGSHLESDIVLVTLPLGVLKSRRVAFNPPLPRWKQDAIDRMGFGLLNKILLAFDESFWQAATPKGKYIGYASKVKGEFYMFIDISDCVGKPTLLAIVSGTVAQTLESLPDDQIISDAMGVLRKIVSPSVAPDPIAFRITRWGSDPFSLGSYSYVSVGCTADDIDALAVSLDSKKVYFAGEATNSEHPSTVHGAFMSGRRAARDLLRYWRGELDKDPNKRYDTFLPVEDAMEGPGEKKQQQPKSICAFCGFGEEIEERVEMIGPLSINGQGVRAGAFHVHAECAMYSPEVGRDRGGWFNIAKAVKRGRMLKCTACKKPGAVIGCQKSTCKVSLHRHCCKETGWNFNSVAGLGGKAYFCEKHR